MVVLNEVGSTFNHLLVYSVILKVKYFFSNFKCKEKLLTTSDEN